MKPTELRQRVERYIRGDRRVADLDRMFLGLRDRSYGLASIREIGDFVAHRHQREKGPVTDKVRDIQLSLQSWLHQGEGRFPDLAKAKRISAANLRTATDEQLTGRFGLRREGVKSVLAQIIRKLETGRFDNVTEREQKVFDYLAGSFIWNPAFTDDRVADDLASVLIRTRALLEEERVAFDNNRSFLALYVTALIARFRGGDERWIAVRSGRRLRQRPTPHRGQGPHRPSGLGKAGHRPSLRVLD